MHTVTLLSLQRQGLQLPEIVCMFSTLQQLEHNIRTTYVDSLKQYKGDIWAVPMQGVYQGHGVGPIVWAVVSSPMLQTMKDERFGVIFQTAISGDKCHRSPLI